MHIDWATDLWDQFDNLLHYADRGAGFCECLENFFRERISIEQEYATKLRRLAKSVTCRRRICQDLYQTLSFTEAFEQIVKEHEDMAGQHELIAEHIKDRVIEDIQMLARLVREQRRRSHEDNSRNKKMLGKVADAMHKALKRYEECFDVARKAGDNYRKANEDINLSRAQVEKARLQMVDKRTICDQARDEYIQAVDRLNIAKCQFYKFDSPQVFRELQNFEETRVNRVKSCLDTYVQCHEEVLPRIRSCLDGMLKASASISFPSDARRVIDFFHSGYQQPPDEVPVDFQVSDGSTSRLSCGSDRGTPPANEAPVGSLSNTLRRSRFGTLLKMKDMIKHRKDSVFDCEKKSSDSSLSKLPPAQRLRRHRHMLSHLERQLKTKQLERQGMLKMQRIYNENPRFGEETTVDEKMKATEGDIADLARRIKNQQILINELSENLNISKASIERCSHSNLSACNGSAHETTRLNDTLNDGSSASADLIPDQVSASTGSDLPDNSADINSDSVVTYLGTALANYDFSSEGFGDGIISMTAGEELRIIEADIGDGWTKVENSSRRVGFVPTSYCLIKFT